jgi:DedD protein
MPLSSLFQRFRQLAASRPAASAEAIHVSPSDVEAARVRARRRLIGMAVLVGAGVIGFPWLFETQPRSMSQDVEMIHAGLAGGEDGLSVARGAPSRSASGKVAVAGILPPPEVGAGDDAGKRMDAEATRGESMSSKPPVRTAEDDGADKPRSASVKVTKDKDKDLVRPVIKQDSASVKPAVKPVEKVADKPVDKIAEKVAEKTAEKATEKSSEKALDKSASRYVVQFGAFADADAAKAARAKVERLGIKTYAQQVDTPGGKRIRVRIGPYADKAEADRALAALRKAGLVGAVLTL